MKAIFPALCIAALGAGCAGVPKAREPRYVALPLVAQSSRKVSPMVYRWRLRDGAEATLRVAWVDDDDPAHEPIHGLITGMEFSTSSAKVVIPRSAFEELWWPNLDGVTLEAQEGGAGAFRLRFDGGDGGGSYRATFGIEGNALKEYWPKRARAPRPW